MVKNRSTAADSRVSKIEGGQRRARSESRGRGKNMKSGESGGSISSQVTFSV